MMKKIRVICSLLLIIALVSQNATALAMTDIEASNTLTINKELEKNIALIEQDLNNQGSDIETGLRDFILLLEQEKNNTNNAEDINKLKRLINTINSLLDDYVNYEYNTNMADSISAKVSNPVYTVAIAAAITWFSNNGYLLSAELLAHMQENTTYMSTYHPYYGTRVLASPLMGQIMMGSASHGSDVFENSGTTQQKDLYYSIHSFYWKKTTSEFTLHDVYDYAAGDYDGIQEIAVNTMYLAQEAGELTPYLNEIIIRY
jgi:hypothetical protein